MPRLSANLLIAVLIASGMSGAPEALFSTNVATAQKEVAVVQHKIDLNKDGKLDELRIDDLGGVSVLISGDSSAGAWTPLAAQGKIVGGSFHVSHDLDPSGNPIILAVAKLRRNRIRTYEEALILSYSPGKLTTLWRGPQGNVDEDGAVRMSVELGEFGLIRYSSRQGVSRCDGKTAYLDAKRYDFRTKTFRAAGQPVRIASDAPVLRTSQAPPSDIPKDARGFWFRAQGASSALRANTTAELVAPIAVTDQSDTTAWVENKNGFGRGEFVSLKASLGLVHVRAIRVVLGHGGAKSDFNRPRRLGLLLGKHQYWVEVANSRSNEEWIVLPKAIATDCVTLIIDDVSPQSASKRNTGRTAISEINILSTEELEPAKSGAFLATRIAMGRGKADTRRLLRHLGTTATQHLVDAIQTTEGKRGKARLRMALATIPAAPEELAIGLLNDSHRSKDFLTLSKGLLKLGAASISPLLLELANPNIGKEASKRIALVLQMLPDAAAMEGLLANIGSGSPHMRRTIINALTARPDASRHMVDALSKTSDEPRRIDLYRALARISQKLPLASKKRNEITAILLTALDAPGLSYKLHYRLLQAAGMCGTEAALTALLTQYKTLAKTAPSNVRDQALSEVAAAAIAQHSDKGDDVATILTDASPGVRMALLKNLRDNSHALEHVIPLLQADTWPEIRRRAAALMGPYCERQDMTDALMEATRTDSDSKVTGTALASLLNCKRNGLFSLLLSIMDDTSRPLGLRLQAARNIASTGSDIQPTKILNRFQNARRSALSNKKNAQIASALTVALGELNTPKSLDLLERSASDPAFPQLQAASLTALSSHCTNRSQRLFRTLKNSTEHTVARAATMAYNRCRR